ARAAPRPGAPQPPQVGDAEPLRLRSQLSSVGTFAGDGGADKPALLFESGERFDQHVEGLYRAQFAEANDVGRVRARHDRGELGLADAIVHHAYDPGRVADFGAEQRCDVATLKQEKVRAPLRES